MNLLGLGTVHIWTGTGIGTWNPVPVPNCTFFRYFSLCNNKNIYFCEKISPKRSISTFWTIGPYNLFCFFSSWNSCVFCFLLKCKVLLFTFTFMHLADAFIQSDLHCIQVTVFFFLHFYQLFCLMHDPHESAPVWPSSGLKTLVKPPSSPDSLVSLLEWCESDASWWLNWMDFPCSYSIRCLILPPNWTDSAVVMVTLGHRFEHGATDGRDLPIRSAPLTCFLP